MNKVKASILLEDIYVEDYQHLLKIMNKVNDNVKLQIKVPMCNFVQLLKEYLKYNSDHLKNIDEYDCIFPEVSDVYGDGVYYLSLNSSDDEDDESDIKFIKEELKRLFGANFNNDVKIDSILKILLMGSEYDIINDVLIIKMYYETYNATWWLKNNIGSLAV